MEESPTWLKIAIIPLALTAMVIMEQNRRKMYKFLDRHKKEPAYQIAKTVVDCKITTLYRDVMFFVALAYITRAVLMCME